MTNWELSLDWALALAQRGLWETPGSVYGDMYVDWVFSRHPDLTPVSEEM